MIIDRITFTGADDSVDPNELITRIATLAENTSNSIEIALLLSADNFGSPRFPSAMWLARFIIAVDTYQRKHGSLEDSLVYIAGHLCGTFATNFLAGKNDVLAMFPKLWSLLDRVQINTHAEPVLGFNRDKMFDIISDEDFDNKEFIFQMDGVNDAIFEEIVSTTRLRAVPLFDTSHGTGVYPSKWPFAKYKTENHGYAGGLSPTNIVQAFLEIAEVTADDTYVWADMETGVRSNNGQLFDLNLVTAVMEQIPANGGAGEIDEEIES